MWGGREIAGGREGGRQGRVVRGDGVEKLAKRRKISCGRQKRRVCPEALGSARIE